MSESPIRRIIAELNSLTIGDIDLLKERLDRSAKAIQELGQEELARKLVEARGCLDRGDVAGYKKGVQNVVSKLGHVKP